MTPPGVWVTLHELERPEADERKVTIRLKEAGRRSVSASTTVSRYSPEASIFRAVVDVVERLTAAQRRIDAATLRALLERGVSDYVEPF